ncbi:MAG: methyltransferase domain-containing protein [Acidobacteriota bacterium]|nr:methyltransferase domain-containing protein [Acidobacteriota bacterium]
MSTDPNYQARLQAETRNYADCQNVDDLPPIFHYWSNRYVRPRLEEFGFSSPTGMFHKYVEEQGALSAGDTLRLLSIGSGNCELEIDLALRLRAKEQSKFVIDCLELNSAMLERARVAAAQHGIDDHINLIQDDFNEWKPIHQYDAAIANQALHHVLNLEHLLTGIKASLKPRGRLIVSDMIGRNGHQLWPEALDILHQLWRKLPPSYRFNNQTRRYEELYVNEDYSRESFEAIRSQDILPLLLQHFHFELFIGFANLINPFVERSFGPHFDHTAPWDRNFIDELQARDDDEILHGRITPTHLLAVLRTDTEAPCAFFGPLSPEFCVRPPGLEMTPTALPQDVYQWGAWPHSLQSEIEIACQRLSESAHRIQNLKHELEQTQLDLEKRTAWAWQREKESEARTAWAFQVHSENRALTALTAQLEADLKQRTVWARQLEKDFDERSAWALDLRRELDEQTASTIELNKQLEERTRWALQLRQELERTAQELKRTAWIRAFWHRFRRLFGLHVRP